MNADSAITDAALINYRRMFHVHVGAVVLTAAVVMSLLVSISSIPAWVLIAHCIVIAAAAIAFVAAAIRRLRTNLDSHSANRIEFLIVTLALSMLQAIFILPVLICVYAPTLRL